MNEWIDVNDRLPSDCEDGEEFYTYEYGKVRDDMWYSAFPKNSDGWGNNCKGKAFYAPNSDPDYGGEFKRDGVTHYMKKPPLPEPPNQGDSN